MKSVRRYRNNLRQRWLRTIEVPDDLQAVTDIDSSAEAPPRSAALTRAAVDEIWDALQDLYRTGVYPLLSLCIRRRGKIVLNRSIGHVREGVVATTDTPICMFSASKAVSAILIHLLAEQNRIHILDPVSYYIPQFAQQGKGGISILQLLTHRGGVPSIPEEVAVDLLFDHEAALSLICAAKPDDHQGRVQAYHAITSGFVIDELIRVTTGLNAQQFLQRYISKPMGMRYFRYGLTRRDENKAALNQVTGPNIELINQALKNVMGADPNEVVEITNDPRFYQAIVPSANLFCTAEEATRFYQMLLNHGEWQGEQILQPLTVYKATRAIGKSEIDKSLRLPMRYSPGFMLGGSPIGMYGRECQYAYGHLGFSNVMCWADPERDIAVALMNTGKVALGSHLRALPALIGTIAEECAPLVDMAENYPVFSPT